MFDFRFIIFDCSFSLLVIFFFFFQFYHLLLFFVDSFAFEHTYERLISVPTLKHTISWGNNRRNEKKTISENASKIWAKEESVLNSMGTTANKFTFYLAHLFGIIFIPDFLPLSSSSTRVWINWSAMNIKWNENKWYGTGG